MLKAKLALLSTVLAAPLGAGATGIEIDITGDAEGTVVIDLFEETAPLHVERIVTLAQEGAYDNVVFHRVIDGFMAQTGDVEFGRLGQDMRYAGRGASSYPDLPAEFSGLPYLRGTIGMARSPEGMDTANSQFFIMFQPEADIPGVNLEGLYTVVGQVVDGMDIVDAIRRGRGRNGAVTGEPDRMVALRVLDDDPVAPPPEAEQTEEVTQ